MKKFLQKLRNTAGETIVETLSAILVCTLSFVLLLGATISAANLNEKAEARDLEIQTAQIAAESHEGEGTGVTAVTVTTSTGIAPVTSNVYDATSYGTAGVIISYGYKEAENNETP